MTRFHCSEVECNKLLSTERYERWYETCKREIRPVERRVKVAA